MPADHPPPAPRVSRPVRNQLELQPRDLESLIAEDHPVRAVWSFVEGLDLSKLYARIEAVEGGPGRPASDPAVLFALWLFATINGVGSARQLDRLTREHDAYRWLRGGVPVDYHLLADFRVGHPEVLEEQLVTGVAALIEAGLVTLEEVAQDGVRVRASAGSGSYRSEQGLKDSLATAEKRVEELREQLEADPGAANRRQAAARERAARERVERVKAALARVPELKERKARNQKGKDKAGTAPSDDDEPSSGGPAGTGSGAPPSGAPPGTSTSGTATAPTEAQSDLSQGQLPRFEPTEASAGEASSAAPAEGPPVVAPRAPRHDGTEARASTTDADADVMKMGDNGFRPAYNAQSCTDTATGIVAAVAITNVGSDAPQLLPMLDAIESTYDRKPKRALTDGGYTSLPNVEATAARGIELYSPPPKPRKEARGRYEPRKTDSQVVADWRVRMGTTEAGQIYRRRASTAEWVNAQYRNHGLQRFGVRGKSKVKAVVLWHAIANNMQVAKRLRAKAT